MLSVAEVAETALLLSPDRGVADPGPMRLILFLRIMLLLFPSPTSRDMMGIAVTVLRLVSAVALTRCLKDNWVGRDFRV